MKKEDVIKKLEAIQEYEFISDALDKKEDQVLEGDKAVNDQAKAQGILTALRNHS